MDQFKIRVPARDLEVIAEFTNESPQTADLINGILPIVGKVNRWGEEIYFSIPNLPGPASLETNSRAAVEVGEIGLWDGMGGCFCIFFGPTPASSGEKPVAASNVSIFARVIKGDPKSLTNAKSGDEIIIDK